MKPVTNTGRKATCLTLG